MKPKTTLVAVWCLLLSVTTLVQGQGQQAPPPPATDTVAPNIPGVVAGGTKVQVIKEGFQGTEGPISLPDGSLIFTETNANRLTKIGVIYPKGGEAVLTDNVDGKAFGRPNDLVVDRKGGVYFTDPGPNLPPGAPPPAALPPPPTVYYVPAGGKTIKIAEGIERPNGILLSRDEKTLYVNNTQGEYLLAFDIQPDGTAGNRRNFAKYEGVTKTGTGVASGADGLAIDSEGRIYAATTAGVQVYSPQGQHLGTIPVSRSPQNLAFAGPDKKTLYLVGRGAAYKIQMQAQGFKDRAK